MATDQNPNNAVIWFEIYVNDITKATTFYETVLNIKLNPMADASSQGLKMASFPMKQDRPNASGALIQMEGVKAGGNSTIVYFDSLDCETEQNRVVKAGGKVFKPKMPIGEHGFMAICMDTEGNMFGLHSMK